MKDIGIGLIGTGFMGKCHALAYRNVHAVLGTALVPRLEVLCDATPEQAGQFGSQFGFARATADWRDLIADERVDLVSITAPNGLHCEMALAAIAAGKHVYCEKPMALTLEQAEHMAAAAQAGGVTTMVGYNYIKNPAITHARALIDKGIIGDIIHFRGSVDEDYQADPDLAWSWRGDKSQAGLGALADLGCHLVSMAHTLVGPIAAVQGAIDTVYPRRPKGDGSGFGIVDNEDIASALIRFANGVGGTFSCSRTAWGRKSRLGWEIHGSKGMICFEQERMNELVLYTSDGPKSLQGFRTILTGPDHPPYGAFCPAPGHQLGFNELKIIELGALLEAIDSGGAAYPSFADAVQFEAVIHAIAQSAQSGQQVGLNGG